MSVTVSDVLQLDILNSAKVIAGKNGLDREVLRINFTDCPINPLVDADLILSGDAFICSFYMNKDMEAKIYDAISFYIQMGSACCIALNEFLPQFPNLPIRGIFRLFTLTGQFLMVRSYVTFPNSSYQINQSYYWKIKFSTC